MCVLYAEHTCRIYHALDSFEGDSETIWVDFENWKKEGRKELASIWNNLGWSFSEEATFASLVKSECHKNDTRSFCIVSTQRITADLGSIVGRLRGKCAH